MDSLQLPPPYRGVNDKLPIIAVQSPQCEELLNWNIFEGGIKLRSGDGFGFQSGLISIDPFRMDSLIAYGTTRLYAIYSYNTLGLAAVFNFETGTEEYTYALGAFINDYFATLYFNNYLFIFPYTSANAGFQYSGAAWAVLGYTGTGTFKPFGGNIFKNRSYLIQKDEAAYWYSAINAIAGALTKVDLSTIVSEKTFLAAIGSFTLSDQQTTDVYQVFIMANGEVLFYSGSYPNASDWQIIGRTKISQPLNYNATIIYQGDTLVLTDAGIVSLRDLFLKGAQQAQSFSVSDNTNAKWKALVTAIRTAKSVPTGPIRSATTGNIRGVYDSDLERIIVSFPYYLDSNGALQTGNYQFVFNANLLAWQHHQSYSELATQLLDITVYKQQVCQLFLNSAGRATVTKKETADYPADTDLYSATYHGYVFDLVSAAVGNGRGFMQKAEGLDVIANSDIWAHVNFQLIKDFGVAQTLDQICQGAVSGSLQKPYVNIGLEGSFIQYRIHGTTPDGTTASIGLELYGINFWYSQGESPR